MAGLTVTTTGQTEGADFDLAMLNLPSGSKVQPIAEMTNPNLARLSASTPFAQATITTSAALPSVPADAVLAHCQIRGGVVMMRPDGATTAPTSSSGVQLNDGDIWTFGYGNDEIDAVRLISVSGSPVAACIYYRGVE